MKRCAAALVILIGCCLSTSGAEGPQRPPKAVSFWDIQDRVEAIAFSPDGKTMATIVGLLEGQGQGALWDLRTMTRTATLNGAGLVHAVAFSPDGRWLATAHVRDSDEAVAPTVVLRDAATARKRLTLELQEPAEGLLFLPDGKSLAMWGKLGAAAGETSVLLWHLNTNTRRALLKGIEETCFQLALSPDGRALVSVSMPPATPDTPPETVFTKEVRLWEMVTGKRRSTLFTAVFEEMIPVVTFSPDGRTLVAGGFAGPRHPGALRLWDLNTGKRRATWGRRQPPAVVLAFAPDGKTLASADATGLVTLRDWPAGRVRATLQGPSDPACLVYSPNGKILAAVETRAWKPLLPVGVRLWEAATGKEILAPAVQAELARREAIYRRQEARQAQARDRRDRKREAANRQRRAEYALRMAQAQRAWQHWEFPQARELLESLRPGKGQEDLRGFEWHYLYKQLPREVLLYRSERLLPVAVLAPDGSLIAVSAGDCTVTLYDTASGKKRRDLANLPCRVETLAFSPNADCLAISGIPIAKRAYSAATVWDVKTGKLLVRFKGRPMKRLLFAPDGQLLAGARGKGGVFLWNLPEGKLQHHLPLAGKTQNLLCFSSDGSTLAVADDDWLQFWDVATGKSRGIKKTRTIAEAFYLPGSRLLATFQTRVAALVDPQELYPLSSFVVADGPVLVVNKGRSLMCGLTLYDSFSGTPRASYLRKPPPLPRNRKPWRAHQWDLAEVVESLALSADGRVIAAVSDAEGLHLLTLPLQPQRFELEGAPGGGLAFSTDGRQLLSSVGAWDATTGKLFPDRAEAAEDTSTVLGPVEKGPPQVRISGEKQSLADFAALHGEIKLAGEKEEVKLAALSPDGRILVTGEDSSIRVHNDGLLCELEPDAQLGTGEHVGLTLRDARTGKPRASLPALPRDGIFRGVAFSPDGRTLVTWAADVVLWDVRTAKERERLRPPGRVLAVSFKTDGKTLSTLVIADARRPLLYLWDVETGKRTALRGHTAFVGSGAVAFSPDGQTLATGDRAGVVRLWDAVTGHPRAVLRGHRGPITHLAFRPNGRSLAVGSDVEREGTISLWSAGDR